MKIINSVKLLRSIAAVMLAVPSATYAANLQDVQFSGLAGGGFEIRMKLDESVDAPVSYSTQNPARIMVDLGGVTSQLAERKYSLSYEGAKNVMFLSDAEKTRAIVSLASATPYEVRQEGNEVILRVSTTGDSGSSSGAYQARASSGMGNSVSNVDFHRNKKGEGVIELELNSSNANIDVSQIGSKIQVKFFQTTLPESLDRRLDVVDFATPVHTVDASQDGSTTVLTIDAVGDYDYMAYQADNKYVISVRELTRQEKQEIANKFAFVGEKLSLNFQDIEVRKVLQIIADFTGLNLVASDSVNGNITLRLDSVPWDQALDIVLKSKGLDKRKEGNVLLVAPAAEIAEQEKLLVESQKQLQELAPLVTEYVRIKYADAEELFRLFGRNSGGQGNLQGQAGIASGANNNGSQSADAGGILSPRGSVIVDTRTNTIIITDTQERIDSFRTILEQLDIPIRQVLIEARIVIATTEFNREIGVRWGVVGSDSQRLLGRDSQVFVTGTQNELVNLLNGDDVIPTAVDLAVPTPAGNITTAILAGNLLLDLELSALENDGFGEIVSQPKVLTGDKQNATISSGVEIPYEVASGESRTTVEFREALLKLDVTPQITPDRRVIMDIKINQDSVGQQTIDGPSIDITEVETQALVGDGQTLVLGGIFQSQSINADDKIPVLGDIPFVGRLFKRTLRNEEKREILVFITPRIVDEGLIDR